MRNFVTVVFDNTGAAYKGLHALWQLDDDGDITVHGTAVVRRDDWGRFEVDTKETPRSSPPQLAWVSVPCLAYWRDPQASRSAPRGEQRLELPLAP